MIKQEFVDLYDQDVAADAILNEEYPGFKQDYLMLHILLRKYKPKSLFEIGTNMGTGTKIIKNVLGPNSSVFSLDLPEHAAHVSLKGDRVGHKCDLPFTQLRGDSLQFDYSKYPCEAYYVDGEHTFEAVAKETEEILKQNPRIIIYHDTDMDCVLDGILHASEGNKKYEFYIITDTRIGYLLRK